MGNKESSTSPKNARDEKVLTEKDKQNIMAHTSFGNEQIEEWHRGFLVSFEALWNESDKKFVVWFIWIEGMSKWSDEKTTIREYMPTAVLRYQGG